MARTSGRELGSARPRSGRRQKWRACFRSMSVFRATSRGRAKLSIPASGKRPCRAVEWRGGSTSTATARAICKAWRRASRGLCLSDRVLSLLAGSAWPQRLRLRPVRREFHGRRPARYGGLHRRPLPDRRRAVRSDAAARHLLSGRHPDERAANGGAARGASPGRAFISASSRRARSTPATRSCKVLAGPERHDRRRDRCAAVFARAATRAGLNGRCASRR